MPQIEGKYTDKPSGISSLTLSHRQKIGDPDNPAMLAYAFSYIPRMQIASTAQDTQTNIISSPSSVQALITYYRAGMTGTLTWSTVNVLDAKLELDNNIAKGLKAEVLTTFKPDTQATGAKLNLHFKQPAFHLRAFTDLLKGPTATIDAVIGHEGFVVGGEAGYDVQKAAVTRYSAAIGYQHRVHNAAITATNNLSIFSASYYNKVNDAVEVGAKAAWDSKSSSTVGMEVAAKYRIDPLSFAKVSTYVVRGKRGY